MSGRQAHCIHTCTVNHLCVLTQHLNPMSLVLWFRSTSGISPIGGKKNRCSTRCEPWVHHAQSSKSEGRVPTFLHTQNSRILHKIPGIIFFFFFFNVASTYNWVSVYTLYITSTPFCLHYPKVYIPPLTPTHNDMYHFERWVLIKKTETNDLMAAK